MTITASFTSNIERRRTAIITRCIVQAQAWPLQLISKRVIYMPALSAARTVQRQTTIAIVCPVAAAAIHKQIREQSSANIAVSYHSNYTNQ
jgi:hypothetical protein